MTATINGVVVSGTPEEIHKLMCLLNPVPQLVKLGTLPYISPGKIWAMNPDTINEINYPPASIEKVR